MALTDWIQTAAVIYFAWQQNRIFKQQNQIFADQAGRSAMSKTSQIPWITRYWPTTVMVGLAVLTGYDIYARHGAPPVIPWWFYAILLLVVPAIGLAIGRLAAPPEKPKEPSKLVIHWANYKAVEGGGEEFQVGDFLRQIIAGDSLVFDIENHNFVIGDKNFVPRDPLWGKEKRLQVNFSYAGSAPVTTERREHGRLLLPEDSKIKWLMSEVDRLLREFAQVRAWYDQLKEQMSVAQQEAAQLRSERDQFKDEKRELTIQRELDVQNAKLRPYPRAVFTVEKVIPEGPATSPTVSLKNKVRIILTNHSDADVSVWTPVWESPDVHADGDPPGSTIQLAKREWQYDEWADEKICATVAIGCSFRCYIALKPTIGESIYRRLETKTALGTLVFPVKIRGKLYDVRINI